MTKKLINQNQNYNNQFLESINDDYSFDNNPINRLKKIIPQNNYVDKNQYLIKLKNEINSIKNCKLKDNTNTIVFGDGNIHSEIMIVGGAPSEKESLSGKTFVGDDGLLLEKMLNAIEIIKKNIYSTYTINFQPPLDRKPTAEEIRKYSIFLQKHISIINPKLIILLGSVAMEALTGLNSKISLERGIWKETIIKNKNYNFIITFDPSYLLRFPENKKYSWKDLKKIKKRIIDLNLNIQ